MIRFLGVCVAVHFRVISDDNLELKQVPALAVALAELCLSVTLSVHLPRAPAGPEILVQHDGALGLDYLVAHPHTRTRSFSNSRSHSLIPMIHCSV